MAESCERSGSGGEKRFASAADYLPSVASSLKQEELLRFYGLYKQATVGKCETAKPAWYAVEAKQKWEAWNSLGDTSKEEAMEKYVDLLSELFPEWETLKATTDNGWVSVSCLADEEAQLEESEKSIFDRVKEGDVEKVKEFAGENEIDVVDEEGMGLIHWASDRGNREMVECLLGLSADVDLRDGTGQTALHYACSCGHYDVVKLLLRSGADPNVVCSDGCLPLDNVTEDSIRSLLESASS